MTRIKELRINAGLSQADLANALNIHQTAVSQWETGRTHPDIPVLIAMANYFEVSLDYLAGRTNNPKISE